MLLSLNTSELIPVFRWRKRGGQKEEEPLTNFKSQLQNPVSFRFVTGHSLLGGIFCVTKETTVSESPCFPSVIWVPLRARVHHSSLPGITQIIPFANQNRQEKKSCYMKNFASTRSDDTVVVCTLAEKLKFSNILQFKRSSGLQFCSDLHFVLLRQFARAGRVP